MLSLALLGCDGDVDAPIGARLPNVRVAARVTAPIDSAVAALDDLLATSAASFDAVVVPAASRLPVELAVRAADAGKHVLVAPPMAFTAEEADRVIAACANAEVRLMVGASERFLPSVRTMKSMLDSGKLGSPGLLRIHRWSPRPSMPPDELVNDRAQGFGLLWRTAVREFDLARWMFGGLPDSVWVLGQSMRSEGAGSDQERRGAIRATPPAPPSEGGEQKARGGEVAEAAATSRLGGGVDYLQIHLGFDGGGMALIDCAETLPAGSGYTSRTLIGSAGAAYADDHHDMQLVYRGGRPSAVKTSEGSLDVPAMLREFVDAIDAGREPSVGGADGRAAIQITQAAAECLASGRAARLTGGRYELV